MGRLLFPDAADAFGYQRTSPNYERTRGMDAYSPQNVAAGIAAAQGALGLAEHVGSEYVKPLAQKVADWRMAARSKLGIPMTEPERVKQSFGGLATAAYGPQGMPQIYDRSVMEPPLRPRKPIVAGGQPVSRPGEIDLQTATAAAAPVTAPPQTQAPVTSQKAPTAPAATAPVLAQPVVQHRNLNYRNQAEQELQRNLMNEYMQLDEAAQNDTGENLPAISKRMQAIQAQLKAFEPHPVVGPWDPSLVEIAKKNNITMPEARLQDYNRFAQEERQYHNDMDAYVASRLAEAQAQRQPQAAPAATAAQPAAPANKWAERLATMDQASLVQIGRQAVQGGRQDLYQAVKDEMDRRSEAETPEQQMLANVQQQVANGAKLTPKAQQQVAQLQAQVAEQQAQRANQAAQQAPQAAGLGESTAPKGSAQAYAQKLGGQLQDVEMEQQPTVPGQPHVARVAPSGVRKNPAGEWEVYVNPKRNHTTTELQNLIAAASRTGRIEDMQAVQQAIMSATFDDAKPQSWMDIMTEIGGGQGSQREAARQQMLAQLTASMPKALSPTDAARLADIESKIYARDVLGQLRGQQTEVAAAKAEAEPERQRLDLERRRLDNQIKGYQTLVARFGVNSAQAKAVLAELKAAYGEQEIKAKLQYLKDIGGAARLGAAAQMKSAKAREFHETHDMQGRGGGGGGGAGERNNKQALRAQWLDLDEKRKNAKQDAETAVPDLKKAIKDYGSYDQAVKHMANLTDKQKAALQRYKATVDAQKNVYGAMELEGSGFTADEQGYYKDKTFTNDAPGGEDF